jgi:hypothetical protein
MSERKKMKVKFFISLKDDLQGLEKKMQEWLDSTPEEESVVTVLPISVGNVVVLIVLYKV